MTVTLYLPHQQPQVMTGEHLNLPDKTTGFIHVQDRVAVLLNCNPKLVDVLASGPEYIVYSVFDSEEAINLSAMKAVGTVSGVILDPDDEDSVLCGPILIITRT